MTKKVKPKKKNNYIIEGVNWVTHVEVESDFADVASDIVYIEAATRGLQLLPLVKSDIKFTYGMYLMVVPLLENRKIKLVNCYTAFVNASFHTKAKLLRESVLKNKNIDIKNEAEVC
jgi:hypothetical protein